MAASDEAWAVVLVVDGVEVVLGFVTGVRPDLAVVDALARLQLVARRLGGSIRLRDPPAELGELLDLVGLADVVGVAPAVLALQPGGQAEGGEQLGVEEVVDAGDPSV